ncbi:hypothetical protein Q3G72_023892 [Acer saccharum]|nr:hypothetical protein Q3G72_023892 [Acer saccharum]
MASNRGHGGIEQLLAAEQEAQLIVNAARNGKSFQPQSKALRSTKEGARIPSLCRSFSEFSTPRCGVHGQTHLTRK